jgi:hypothetical protein
MDNQIIFFCSLVLFMQFSCFAYSASLFFDRNVCLQIYFYSNSEDLYKRRLTRYKVKGVQKPFNIPIQDRSSCFKFPLIKLVLVIIIGGTVVSLLYSPDVDQLSHPGSRYISPCLFTCSFDS